MENIGALAILVSFCLAIFAIAASLTGKYYATAVFGD